MIYILLWYTRLTLPHWSQQKKEDAGYLISILVRFRGVAMHTVYSHP